MNFEFLKENKLNDLYLLCSEAELFVLSRPDLSASASRKALEYLVKLIYQVKYKNVPSKLTLFALVTDNKFSSIIANDSVLSAIHFVRVVGNNAIHNEKVSKKEALQSLQNLHFLVGEILILLGVISSYNDFIKELIPRLEVLPEKQHLETELAFNNIERFSIGKNATINKTINISEAQTRQLYIDLMLKESGWDVLTTKGAVQAAKACIEVEISGMPNHQGVGFADYVLFDDNGKPLAVIEAKRTSVDPISGSEQAKLYAKSLEEKYKVKPVIYYTNGYKTWIIDRIGYPARQVFGFHSKHELQLLIQRQNRGDIHDMKINDDITNRPYQKEAITSLLEHFNNKKRKGLMVLATGTGKTRTAISLVEILSRNNWVKNVLFLADRVNLVNQAKKWFSKFLPSFNTSVLSDGGVVDYNARLTFSTYQTLINLIDGDSREFGVGRFDLIIIDEAHRSIFNKYKAIFTYFDSLLIGLTATPREEIERSTYSMFDLDDKQPNSYYPLEQAVSELYLVNFKALERTTERLKYGLKYDDLSEDEKEQYDESDLVDIEDSPGVISGNKFYSIITNEDTIAKVLETLMNEGLHVNQGDTLGKSLIFAKDHNHAIKIVEKFKSLYPKLGDDFCKLIDNQVRYAHSIQDDFDNRNKMPQIVVSVDMMDTGVDIPDIVNLVFFKRVYSKIKFWQMIGRGTRLSENIWVDSPSRDFFEDKIENADYLNRKDKQGFYIFDFCGVFDYFRMNPDGRIAKSPLNLSQKIFEMKLDLLAELQRYENQIDEATIFYYEQLKVELYSTIKSLNRNLINVRDKLQYVDKYSIYSNWDHLTIFNLKEIKHQITKLIPTIDEDEKAKSLDLKMFYIELCALNKQYSSEKAILSIVQSSKMLLAKLSIPDIKNKKYVLEEIIQENFWNSATVNQLERIRIEIRDLMKFLENHEGKYETDFNDNVIVILNEPNSGSLISGFKSYKEKVIDFIQNNLDSNVIRKIRFLEQLDTKDFEELEDILWNQLGSKDDYFKCVDNDNLAVFIRSLVGIEQEALNEKFSNYLSGNYLNSKQQEFIRTIINYVKQNGDILKEDLIERMPFKEIDWYKMFNEKVQEVSKIADALHGPIVARTFSSSTSN